MALLLVRCIVSKVLVLLRTNMCLWHAWWMPYAPNFWPVCHWDAQDLSSTHLDPVLVRHMKTLVSASQWSEYKKKSMRKNHVDCRKQLYRCIGCLIALHRWSAKQITWQATTSVAGLEKFWIFVFRKCWDTLHLMWPYKNSGWPPRRKERRFPH